MDYPCAKGSVSIVRRFDSPKIQLKLKLALTLTDTGDLLTIEPSDYRADTVTSLAIIVSAVLFLSYGQTDRQNHTHTHRQTESQRRINSILITHARHATIVSVSNNVTCHSKTFPWQYQHQHQHYTFDHLSFSVLIKQNKQTGELTTKP